MYRLRKNNQLEMKTLISRAVECDDDANKKQLIELWGDSLEKLTPEQRQLVVEILNHKKCAALSLSPAVLTTGV